MRQQRPMPGMWLRRVWLTFVAGLVAVGLGAGPARAATNGRVLILDSTVFDGPTSTEAQAATAAGRGADVVSPAQWAAMSTADFASYDALVLGDPDCGSFTPAPIAVPTANAAVWSPAVNGNVVVMGVTGSGQALFHSTAGTLVRNSIAYAVARPGATGLFVSLSCYYVAAPPGTPVPLLDRLSSSGTFAVEGRSDVTACLDTVHIVAPAHPVLAGLTDADLSNWGCSTDEAFDTFPSDFEVLALNRDLPATYTAADGSTGGPYILARRQSPAPPGCGTATSRIGTQQMQPAVDKDADGLAEAFRATAGASGAVSVVCVYLDATNKATSVTAGLYADNGHGHPGALLAQGSLAGAPVNGAFNAIQIPPVALAAGTDYWITLLSPFGTPGAFRFRDRCCGSTQSGDPPSENSREKKLTALPATWTSGTVYPLDGPLMAWGGGA